MSRTRSTGALESKLDEEGRSLKVAGAQIEITQDISKNLRTLERALAYAVTQAADILVTPEGALSGYWADFDPQEVVAAEESLLRIVRECSIALPLGTCFLEPDGKRYDEIRFYDRTGQLRGVHAKILLCKNVGDTGHNSELDRFATKPLGVIDFEGVTSGGLVCNDLWADPEVTVMDDPHLTQQLADRGARVIYHAVNSGQSTGDELSLQLAFHDSNLRMRARAARVWIVTVDAADRSAMRDSRAPSGIVDPRGSLDSEGSRARGAILCR